MSTIAPGTPPGVRIRVLVVDDSAFARKVIRETLAADPRIELVGHAADGLEALEKIAEHRPDVVTMDLLMPELDGVGVLRALRQLDASPRVVVVTSQDDDTAAAITALQEGAFDVVVKPTAVATDLLYAMGKELAEKVVLAGLAGAHATASNIFPVTTHAAAKLGTKRRLIVIGTSTGGPRAVTVLLRALPADLGVPIAVVVHMPEGFTQGFAERLDRQSALDVFEARSGVLRPGSVAIARAGLHLRVAEKDGSCMLSLTSEPREAMHRPSVDELFSSAADAFGGDVLGVVLTGMGSDGLEGARKLRAAGARLIAEAESTCTVFGMPRAVIAAGLTDTVLPLEAIAEEIVASSVH